MISLDAIKKKADPGYVITKDGIDIGRALDPDEVFEDLMESYSVYYNVTRKDGEDADPFCTEAVFDSKGEQYFLIKAAKVAEMHTAEYVYFARVDKLDIDKIKDLDTRAWELGMSHVCPGPNHKNTDAVLIVTAGSITEEAAGFILRAKHSKNYKMALHGYSNYRLVAIETESGRVLFNKQAKILKGLIGNILVRRSKTRG